MPPKSATHHIFVYSEKAGRHFFGKNYSHSFQDANKAAIM